MTLALLTFVQEDTPTVSAALLSAAGSLSWRSGFLGCFLGIWIGDALLYLVARAWGRPLAERGWVRRFLDRAAVAQSERWFEKKGTWLILTSRFVPGTRLPTYLAAGFLRLSFPRFLLMTGIAVGVWTAALFGLARLFGDELLARLRSWGSGGWTILVATALLVIAIRWLAKIARPRLWRKFGTIIDRWSRWEFWPTWLFYIPVGIYYVYLAMRYGGLTVPTASNPGIFSGGFVGESKIATLEELSATSPEFTARAHLLGGAAAAARLECLDELCRAGHLQYPFILKPDVGQRGVGVKLVRAREQAAQYFEQTRAPLIAQQYAPGPHEVGVFYYRFPGEVRGHVFAITEKIFPVVAGDGEHTIEELVCSDDRCRFQAPKYLERLGSRRAEVLPHGQTVRLVEAGNHAQGCIFQDGAHLGSPDLERRIDEISQRLSGFFIGRYDIRYARTKDLRRGQNFQIVELNGAAAEATSIYDARNSIWKAYRTLFQQWKLVFAIGAANRRSGSPPTDIRLLFRKWRETVAEVATYPLAD
jgi:membrane protein DedA with SNARE-associated domain